MASGESRSVNYKTSPYSLGASSVLHITSKFLPPKMRNHGNMAVNSSLLFTFQASRLFRSGKRANRRPGLKCMDIVGTGALILSACGESSQ